MQISLIQIALLALIQGAAELLPVSSSAHVIIAEKAMGLDPSSPEMTFLLVMLHTGTMLAVLAYFRKRWMAAARNRGRAFLGGIVLATALTGILGLLLKKLIEAALGMSHSGNHAEVEALFGNLWLIAFSLLTVGVLILFSGSSKFAESGQVTPKKAAWIGLIQGLCLPFRGFSRSGATISTGLLLGVSREAAEDFSFALAVVLTPAVVALEARRLFHSGGEGLSLSSMLGPGLLGMVLAALAGWFALKFLSSWLERGRWSYFGYYCIVASLGVMAFALYKY